MALSALVLGAAPHAGSAQVFANPQVPAGRVRVDFAPSFNSWDTRYGLRTDGGTTVEEEEPLGLDLTDPVGTKLFPGMVALQDNLRALTGDAAYQPRLGETFGSVTKEVVRIEAGIHVGVFDWLTVGVMVPMVRSRSAVDAAFRAAPDADLGLNPVVEGSTGVAGLLAGLESAAGSAQARAASLCQGGGGAQCAEAQALAAQASSFQSNTQAAYYASPFFPIGTSPAGASLSAALAALDASLVAAGLAPVGSAMQFAAGVMSGADFATLATHPAVGVAGSPLRTVDGEWALGDVELSASVRLLDGEVRDSGAAQPRLAYTLSAGATVRMGTGTTDDPNIFFDVGSGDGQMDFEGRVDGTIQMGARFGMGAGLRYGIQDGVVLVRRVAPPDHVLAPISTSRTVQWTPGSYSFVDLSPRVLLTPDLALSVEYRRYHKGNDSYELAGEPPAGLPPVDVKDLELETEMTVQEVGVGVRYSTLRTWRDGGRVAPMEMGLRLVRALSGAGGQTPKATRLDFSVGLFPRIWGAR